MIPWTQTIIFRIKFATHFYLLFRRLQNTTSAQISTHIKRAPRLAPIIIGFVSELVSFLSLAFRHDVWSGVSHSRSVEFISSSIHSEYFTEITAPAPPNYISLDAFRADSLYPGWYRHDQLIKSICEKSDFMIGCSLPANYDNLPEFNPNSVWCNKLFKAL